MEAVQRVLVIAAFVLVLAVGLGARNGSQHGAPVAPRLHATRFALAAPPVAVATAGGSMFVVVEKGRRALLWRLDPRTGRRLAAYTVGRAGDERVMTSIRTGVCTSERKLPFAPDSLAVAAGRIWATNNCGCAAGKLAVDRATGQTRSVAVGETPALTATATTAWVASFGDSSLWRVEASHRR